MLTGYTDRILAAAGDRVEFKVHSDAPYDLRIVRLIQGDDSAAALEYLEMEVGAACDGNVP